MVKNYTISVLTEDTYGLLNKITIIFTRRKINVESLNVSSTEIKGISRFTIVINSSMEQINKMCKQIRKLVDVLGAFVYQQDEVHYQEIALYKVSKEIFSNKQKIDTIIKDKKVRIFAIEKEYIILEKTGHKEETHDLYTKLQPYGLLEFVRSGRVAISKSVRRTEDYIMELEKSKSNLLSIKNY